MIANNSTMGADEVEAEVVCTLPDVAVVDYGAGNVGNVMRALTHLGAPHRIATSPAEARGAGALLLPGVGAFRAAMEKLSAAGWPEFLKGWARDGRPLVGICLGMQLMCASSCEDGHTDGLGIFDAAVERLDGIEKIPHMGWNSAVWGDSAADFAGGAREQDFYFVHGYAVMTSADRCGATTVDGVTFCSALRRGAVLGFQFHPERSGEAGVKFLGRAIAAACAHERSGRGC